MLKGGFWLGGPSACPQTHKASSREWKSWSPLVSLLQSQTFELFEGGPCGKTSITYKTINELVLQSDLEAVRCGSGTTFGTS